MSQFRHGPRHFPDERILSSAAGGKDRIFDIKQFYDTAVKPI
jgi:hypothetical protein